ncbi:uncharacterized protein J7T54_003971 [Emericellopsis cladophorae]|uniref:Uncharacterized protein n=1 Tax=Emericellopsis cladophorae TaxID=2686198 RepID=A0A9P9Y1N1_9HYPO|nr:uncharacterized protein J7T54_003971 [Emericellopsis cladophorae]KAI6781705.1 hypothetical protein J7T54_003971 [Emericellopsis cladophorae]
MALTSLVTTALLWPFGFSSAAIQAPNPPILRELGSLPAPGFFENMAIRPSTSSVLATRLTGGPEAYIVKNPGSSAPDLDVLLGIDQIIPDEAASAGGERVYVIAHLGSLLADTGLLNDLGAVPSGVLTADSVRSRVSFYNLTDNSFTASP